MMFTQEQIDWMNGDGKNRAFSPWYHWPRTGQSNYINIPYIKDENEPWSSAENLNIQAAIDAFKDNTCIRYCVLAKKLYIYHNLP